MTTQSSLSKLLKGITLLFPFLMIFVYMNIDLIDNKVNINMVNGIIFAVTTLAMWVILIVLYKLSWRRSIVEMLGTNPTKKVLPYLRVLSVYLLLLTLSGISNQSLELSDIAISIINLFLLVIILLISFLFRLSEFALFSALLYVLIILNTFSFISFGVVIMFYILIYGIATFALINLLSKRISAIKE